MKRLRKDCAGFTLVELIVTFTLTAIFVASATLVLSTFMHSHTVASAVATEQNVSSIVMETISGALSSARYKENIFDGTKSFDNWTDPGFDEDQKKACSLLIKKTAGASDEVWYVDGDNENVVRMYLKDGDDGKYLALDYYVKKNSEDPTVEQWETTPSPWQLGVGVYQHCTIESFQVSQIKKEDSSEESSCLKVTLKLKNGLAGDENSFTLQRAFDCYNLAPENIVVK